MYILKDVLLVCSFKITYGPPACNKNLSGALTNMFIVTVTMCKILQLSRKIKAKYLEWSGTPPYDNLVVTTNFLCPEQIESLVISLVFQPR